ncbi:MAG: tRNA(fMet)-specific endonuclease VapC [Methanonatronarchaeales archaeon]|nr:tRNA(fMet)-specific endonuclease VapC [Methanonatronarchaeales archaeon]
MTLYDSSILIDYLNGDGDALDYIEDHIYERAVTVPLVKFEVYQGEVFKNGPTDLRSVDNALKWLTVVDETPKMSRTAAELQDHLRKMGEPLTARDAYIAGAAKELNERLAATDSDFDAEGLRGILETDVI